MNDDWYSNSTITSSIIPTNTFTVKGKKGLIVEINFDDGTHKFGENYTLDEAAKEFWKIVLEQNVHQ